MFAGAGRVAILAALALAISGSHVPVAYALTPLEAWNAQARDALALPIKMWLGAMMLTNLAAVAFVKNYVAARWVFGGFVISHGLVMLMWAQNIPVLSGQVSLFHILFWTPGMLALILRRRDIALPSAYGVWASLSLLFYFGSMWVDIGHAYTFVRHLL